MWSQTFIGLPGVPPTTSLAGTAAQRPQANYQNAGWLYLATDTNGGTLYRSNGVAWVQAAGAVSGGVSDGDKGDITVSGSGATWTIDADAVTDAKLRDSAALSVIGNASAITLSPADIVAGTNDRVLAQTSNVLFFQQLTVGMFPDDVVTYAKVQNVSATSRVLARKTAGAGNIEECTFSEVLDFVGSAAQGDILYRNATAWVRLGAGTSGDFLKTQGASANPVWATNAAPSAASAAEQETGTEAAKYVAPATQHRHASAVKAWCQFTGAAGAEALGSPDYNTESISETATGDWTLAWTTDFSSSVYGFAGMCKRDDASDNILLTVRGAASAIGAASLRVAAINTGGTKIACQFGALMAAGDHA